MLSSLRTRLVLICVSIVVLSMLALSVANYITTRSSMLASADQQMQQLLQSQSAVLAQWVDGKKKVMASVVMSAETPDPLRAFQIAEKAGDFAEVFIGYADKRSVFTHPGRPADFDPTVRAWYTDTVKAGMPMLTPPYVDAASHKLVVSFTAPVGPKEALLGVAGADVLLDTVIANVVAIKPTPHSLPSWSPGRHHHRPCGQGTEPAAAGQNRCGAVGRAGQPAGKHAHERCRAPERPRRQAVCHARGRHRLAAGRGARPAGSHASLADDADDGHHLRPCC